MIKKSIATVISVVLVITSIHFPVISTAEDSYNNEIIPTEAPTILPGDSSMDIINEMSIDDSNYVLPEKTSEDLINNKESVVFEIESSTISADKMSLDEIYNIYSEIITGNEDTIDSAYSYYSTNIANDDEDIEDKTIYDILGTYFTDDEVSVIEQLNNEENDNSLYVLLALFIESDIINDNEKTTVCDLVKSEYTILESLNAYMSYKRKAEHDSDNSGNLSEAIKANILREEENSSDNSAIQSISSTNDERQSLYNSTMTDANYYIPQSGNIEIDDRSGNLRYSRCDVNIPLKTGYMRLELCYSVEDARAAFYAVEDGGVSRDTSLKKSPLGVGWRFNLTRMENSILYLRDGRRIELQGGKMRYNYYKDIKVEYYDHSADGYSYMVTYLDGSVDYIDSKGLLYESTDKYGNVTEYEYKSINGFYTLSKMSSQGKTISIDYNTDSTVIHKPDGALVKYEKSNSDITYGRLANQSYKDTIQTLDKVVLVKNNEYLCDAFFYYNLNEINTYTGYLGRIYCYDYNAFLSISEIEGSDGTCYMYGYTRAVLNSSTSGNLYGLKVSKKQISPHEVVSNNNYSSVDYTSSTRHTETFTNNKLVKTIIAYDHKTVETYEKTDNSEILKNCEEITYEQHYEHRPETRTIKVYNSNGNSITTNHVYTYNSRDQLLTDKVYIDDELYSETYYEYTNNYLTKETYKRNNKMLYTNYYIRNKYGDIIKEYVADSDGIIERYVEYEYNTNHNVSSKKIKNDSDSSYEYIEQYNYIDKCLPSIIKKTDGSKTLSQISYTYDNDNGNISSVTDGNGNKTKYIYNARGHKISEIYPDGSFIDIYYNLYNSNGYNSYYTYQPVKVVFSNDYSLEYSYTHTGNTYKIREQKDWNANYDVLNSAEYDIFGNLISETDANGNTVNVENDIFGRQTSVTYPQITDSASKPVRAYYYDVFFDGNEKCSAVLKIDPTNKASIMFYNVYGQNYKNAVIKNMSSLSNANWDSIVELPSNTQLVITQRNEFDELGRVRCSYDGENRKTSYIYNIYGDILKKTTGAIEESYIYNSLGQVSSKTVGTNKITYEYDMAGRLIKTTDALGYTESYTYDLNNNVISSKDKNGVYTYNTYDSMNRLTKTTKSGRSISYTYDKMGNMLTSKDSSGAISYSYNDDSTLAQKTYPDGKKISYSYDLNKNVTSMTDYFGNITDYTYNNRNQISSVAEKYSGESDYYTTTYQYNDDGSLARVNMPRNMTTYYTYDYAGRVTYLNNTSPYLDTKATFKYTYDNSGNITGVSQTIHDKSATKQYSYDSSNRLSSEKSSNGYNINYYYDQNNNLKLQMENDLIISYKYDDNNRLLFSKRTLTAGESVSSDYSYDNVGNLLTVNTYNKNEDIISKEYDYNAWGQLTQYSEDNSVKGTYSYYSDGLRATRKTGNTTIQYYYNGGDIINETKNGSNNATNVMGVNGIISRKADGKTGYYWKDVHGNVVYIFGGYRFSDYDYTGWGDEADWYDWYPDFNRMRYCGEYYDEESGLTYLRGRYYSSDIKRFITEDPAKDGVNWYAYCGNNPIMLVDPWGMKPGDKFNSTDDAAKDFGMYINTKSIDENIEYGTYIYSFVVDEWWWGEYGLVYSPVQYYSYTEPHTDNSVNTITFYIDSVKNLGSLVATAHTHGAVRTKVLIDAYNDYLANDPDTVRGLANKSEQFSDIDKNEAKKNGLKNYLITPTGKLKVYDPNKWFFKEKTILETGLPYDWTLDWF